MATATLLCKQCNFENEPERVYCHNCGAKLDRSLLPPEATRREDPVLVQERVRKMVNPRRGMGLRQVKNLILSLVLAAVFASLLLIIKPPANLPELSKEAILNAPALTEDLGTLEDTPNARPVRYEEAQINAFLQSSLRGQAAPSSSAGASMKFERAFVHFHEGSCSITIEESIFGLSIYATTVRTVVVQGGALVAPAVGGTLGSLKIPAPALPYLDGMFSPLWKALEHDRAQVARLQAITFHEKTVDFTPRPLGR